VTIKVISSWPKPASALIQRADDFLELWDRAVKDALPEPETERERRYREGVERRTDWIVSRLEGSKK
jgi:hypothetical protein